jgi:hypothetical protein
VLASQASPERPDLRPAEPDQWRQSQVFVKDGADGRYGIFGRQLRIRLDEPRRSTLVEFHTSDARGFQIPLPERGRFLAECSLETAGELVVTIRPALRRREALIAAKIGEIPQRCHERLPFLGLQRGQENVPLAGVVDSVERREPFAVVSRR